MNSMSKHCALESASAACRDERLGVGANPDGDDIEMKVVHTGVSGSLLYLLHRMTCLIGYSFLGRYSAIDRMKRSHFGGGNMQKFPLECEGLVFA